MARPPAGPPPVTTAVARRDDAPSVGLAKYQQIVEEFNRPDRQADLVAMLKSEEEKERFMSVTFNAIATNSDLLARASLPSIIQAVKDSAALGLEPTGLGGEAYILRFGEQAVLIPGWRGYLKRIRNSGMVEDVDCHIVYENDEFEYREGTDAYVHHKPNLDTKPGADGKPIPSRGAYKGAYAFAVMPSGRIIPEWMTVADIEHDAKAFSPSVKGNRSSPWDSHWGEMARKTVIRRLSKRLPQSAVTMQLEAIERRAEEVERETVEGGENGAKRLNVTKARAAVLAQIAARSGRNGAQGASAQPSGTGPSAGERPPGATADADGAPEPAGTPQGDKPGENPAPSAPEDLPFDDPDDF